MSTTFSTITFKNSLVVVTITISVVAWNVITTHTLYTVHGTYISDQKISKTFQGENRHLLFGAFARRACAIFLMSRVKISHTTPLSMLAIAAWKRLLSYTTITTVKHKSKFVQFKFTYIYKQQHSSGMLIAHSL